MLSTKNIQSVIGKNELADELYVEINGEILELCNITIIDGKLVLRPEVKL
jgi:hypothetical protein